MNRFLYGYANVFDVVDVQGEKVARGAFIDTLIQHKVRGTMPLMLYEHEPGRVAGEWTRMEEDEHGLWVEGVLYEPCGYSGLSIGFDCLKSHREGGVRVIDKVGLLEVSLVQRPANGLSIPVTFHFVDLL